MFFLLDNMGHTIKSNFLNKKFCSYFLKNFYSLKLWKYSLQDKNKLRGYIFPFGSFSILSKQVEHNKWPFLIQYVLVDLSISRLQIRHLNIGDIWKQSKGYF